jgi:hypothetical protein
LIEINAFKRLKEIPYQSNFEQITAVARSGEAARHQLSLRLV